MEKSRIRWIVMAAIVMSACSFYPLSPDEDGISIKTGWVRSQRPIQSWVDLRDRNVVIQRYDYSCGASALATLMHYYFGDPVGEAEILIGILDSLTNAQVRDREQNGLSLLDLKRYAEQRGYQAVAIQLKYAGLQQLKGPVLIHLQRQDYQHFAVLKGIRGDRIFLADPSRGNVRMPIFRFAREWTGVALVLGREEFGLPSSYPLAVESNDTGFIEMESARRALYSR